MRLSSILLGILIIGIWASAQVHPSEMKNFTSEKDITTLTFEESGIRRETHEIEKIITTDAGRMELSLNRFKFFGKSSSFKLLKAYSITQGKISEISPHQVTLSPVPDSQYGLSDLTQAIVPMNNLSVGSKVYIKYEVMDNSSILGYGESMLGVTTESLAKIESYYVESTKPLKFAFIDADNFFILQQMNHNGKYSTFFIPSPLAYQSIGKYTAMANLLISDVPSWEVVNKKMFPAYEKVVSSPLPPQLQKIASSAKALSSSKEKIEFIAKELSKLITYSGDWRSDATKMFPQTFQQLLSSRKGDCKDYASTMTAILRQVDFKSYPSLIMKRMTPTQPEYLKKMSQVPGLSSFNHALVWAKDSSGKEWWIDPTNPLVFADTLSSDILGNYALVLDNQSTDIKFLPEKNLSPSDVTIEQTLSVGGDNFVQASGQITFSEPSYLDVGQLERMLGEQGFNKVLSAMLNSSVQLNLKSQKKATSRVPEYSFSYLSPEIIKSKDITSRYLNQPAPIQVYLRGLSMGSGALGESGTFKLKTLVKNSNTDTEFEDDCFVVSPWFDYERYVENKNQDLLVTDTIKTKKRFISKTEMQSDEFRSTMSHLYSCASSYSISLTPNNRKKSEEELAQEKDLGPPIAQMTQKDVERLQDLSGPKYYTIAAEKILKYSYLKLEKNPNDVDALVASARAIRRFGYTYGQNYYPAYLEEGLNRLNRALKVQPQNANVLRSLVKTKSLQKKFSAAILDLQTLLKIEPNSFETRVIAGDLARAQNSYDIAEKWYKSAIPLAKTKDDETSAHDYLANLLMDQSRYAEAEPHYLYLLNAEPNNPWTLHNTAILYFSMNNLDRAIELEKKALSISNFGAASSTLSRIYQCKAGFGSANCMNAAKNLNFNSKETFLIESVKYQPENEKTLQLAARFYLDAFETNPNQKIYLDKAKAYSDVLMQINPKNISNTSIHENIAKKINPTSTVSVPKPNSPSRIPASTPQQSR